MAEWLAKQLTRLLGFLTIVILIAGTGGGGFGFYMITRNSYAFYKLGGAGVAVSIILGALLGFVIAYFAVVICFGFIAQVMSINKKLERVEKKLDEIKG